MGARNHDGTYCGTCGSGTQELAGMLVGFGRTRETATPGLPGCNRVSG